ncbi:hypothetical protein Smar_0422 [Staphylothermus marinus F1]|uniref:SAM-dependent MTase RsmB/NOP-type domain-containing protein n=1 Tax=Staphylothermus marinus (strain ATCC 43588 / DSM 3639 / JCM 9404 / F1) TaxID=399550 RepID=A3DLM3_STAMF|nr:hypothetical protein [Staphylothermus marinus]ABN69533.1 hypothetical protein Smar_0422 [Staphylothermus marinus F1]
MAVEILDPKPETKIADLCAAPGGKTICLFGYYDCLEGLVVWFAL